LVANPNWAEQVTAIATAIGCIGLTSTLAVAVLAARQVRESQRARHAQVAADFIARWSSDQMVETRRLVATFASGEELAAAFQRYIAQNAEEAYVLYRELDYFEQLGALDHVGAVDFELIRVLNGPNLVERWTLWQASISAMGDDVYPMFRALVEKLRAAAATAT